MVPYTRHMGKILVVDADRQWRNRLADLLRAAGYESFAAESEADALVRLGAGDADAVFYEYANSPSNGLEFVSEARRVAPGVPLVIVTARGSVSVVSDAFKRGVMEFLEKTATEQELLDTAWYALHKNRVFRHRTPWAHLTN